MPIFLIVAASEKLLKLDPPITVIDGRALNEASIKAAVLSKLIRQNRISSGSILASEFAIYGTKTRADLAILGRQLLGIEIKSAADSLRRLSGQLATYQNVFDRVLLVVAQRHLSSFDKSKYPWLEIWVVDNSLRISVVQKPTGDVRSARIDDYRRFLTVEDLKPSKKGGSSLGSKAMFIAGFRSKFEQTSKTFWQSLPDNYVRIQNVEQLSRFKERKERDLKYRAAREEYWADWLFRLRSLPRVDGDQSVQSSSVEYNLAASS